jgi:peptidoglycan/LPS O-acetylase OafA/YrhL
MPASADSGAPMSGAAANAAAGSVVSGAVAPAASHARIDQLDGLRALAFLAVFLHHAVHAPLLWMGVDLFFALSGYLITRNLLTLREQCTTGRALGVFFYRRVLRILPPYYLALAVIAVVHGFPDGSAPWYLTFTSNLRDALYGAHEGALNTMWSIAVEEQFYIAWPWVVLLVPRRHLGKVFVLVVLVAPGVRAVCTGVSLDAVYRLMPARMDLLAMGALLALMDTPPPEGAASTPGAAGSWIHHHRHRFLAAAALAFAAFVALSVGVPSFRTSNNTLLFNVVGFSLAGVFFASSLAYVRATDRGPVAAVLRHPVLRYVGKISYMAYLTHMVAIEVVKWLGFEGLRGAPLSLALTLAFSSLTWYLLEQPLLGLRGVVSPKPANRAGESVPATV